jgi:hypothetical protein
MLAPNLDSTDPGQSGDRSPHSKELNSARGETVTSGLMDEFAFGLWIGSIYPNRTASIDIDPPSNPSTGKVTGSPGRRNPITYSKGR